MSPAFYKSIIEDEIRVFGVKEESLKQAAKSVSNTYSRKSLTAGQTFLDYNIPSNRCAYIYKYASIHTGLVVKYFRQLMNRKVVQSSLKDKETLKICCLGGGPGTDIVGLFKVLALDSQFHKKVVEVTVLDICGGWRNSFKRIISNLMGGKVKEVPETFIDASNFKFKLLEVNLLCNLPSNIMTVIAEADIVCMVKFVSAILGSTTSVSALQVIGEKLKIGAVVLFIDNFHGNTFKPVLDISVQIGLHTVIGPLHESFNKKGPVTANEKNMFGCQPLCLTRVTVLGFVKSDKVYNNIVNHPGDVSSKEVFLSDGDEDSWDTDDELETYMKQLPKCLLEYKIKICHDKFTQTDKRYIGDNSGSFASVDMSTVTPNVLCSLVDRLCELANVLSQWKQQMSVKKHSCYCH